MRRAGFVRRREKELVFWYRPALRRPADASEAAGAPAPTEEALVFVHGVGFGPFPYVSNVERWGGSAPIVMIEVEGATQRIAPRMPPQPDRFATLLDSALASLGIERAVLAGHSLGSAFV